MSLGFVRTDLVSCRCSCIPSFSFCFPFGVSRAFWVIGKCVRIVTELPYKSLVLCLSVLVRPRVPSTSPHLLTFIRFPSPLSHTQLSPLNAAYLAPLHPFKDSTLLYFPHNSAPLLLTLPICLSSLSPLITVSYSQSLTFYFSSVSLSTTSPIIYAPSPLSLLPSLAIPPPPSPPLHFFLLLHVLLCLTCPSLDTLTYRARFR